MLSPIFIFSYTIHEYVQILFQRTNVQTNYLYATNTNSYDTNVATLKLNKLGR